MPLQAIIIRKANHLQLERCRLKYDAPILQTCAINKAVMEQRHNTNRQGIFGDLEIGNNEADK